MMKEQAKTPAVAGWGIMMTLAMAMLLAALGTSIANIALPTLALAFSAPFASVQPVVVAYLAALTISVFAAGWLGDRYGLKPMLVTGLGLFAMGSSLGAVAPDLALLIGARVVQGIGAAFMMTLAMALMRTMAGDGRIGQAMGLLGTVSAVGTALGPALGGLLIPVTGWRGIFWAPVPLAVLALILTVTRLPGGQRAGTAAAGQWSVLGWPLLPHLIGNVLVAATMMTTLVVGPFYLSLGLGLDARQVGLVMAVGPAMSIVTGVPSGRLVDAWGSFRVLVVGLVLLTTGAMLMAFLPIPLGVVGYMAAILVLTPGFQLFQAANNTAALADAPASGRGTVSGALNLSRNIGLIVGALAMGGFFAWDVGGGDLTQASAAAIDAGLRQTFLLAAGLMLLAIGVAAVGHRSLTSTIG